MLRKAEILFLAGMLLFLPAQVLGAWRTGGVYEISDDTLDCGGQDGNAAGIYENDGSLTGPGFVSTWNVDSSTDLWSGYFPNINNIPAPPGLTYPPNGTAITDVSPVLLIYS